jgi:hypothetical protein
LKLQRAFLRTVNQTKNVGNKESDDVANEGNDMTNSRMEEAMTTSSVRETVPEPGDIGIDTRKRLPLSRESPSKSASLKILLPYTF